MQEWIGGGDEGGTAGKVVGNIGVPSVVHRLASDKLFFLPATVISIISLTSVWFVLPSWSYSKCIGLLTMFNCDATNCKMTFHF